MNLDVIDARPAYHTASASVDSEISLDRNMPVFTGKKSSLIKLIRCTDCTSVSTKKTPKNKTHTDTEYRLTVGAGGDVRVSQVFDCLSYELEKNPNTPQFTNYNVTDWASVEEVSHNYIALLTSKFYLPFALHSWVALKGPLINAIYFCMPVLSARFCYVDSWISCLNEDFTEEPP